MRMNGGTLAASNVTKSYGADVVLDGASVVVPPGARIGIVGPNGSGKTTLLRVLAGLEAPDSGLVERRPASLTVGYLPQDARIPSVDAPEWELRKSAARVGLDVDPDRPPGQLTMSCCWTSRRTTSTSTAWRCSSASSRRRRARSSSSRTTVRSSSMPSSE
jgi:energy-coupling factor transporter ATP-binding protein EcfA2